MKKVAIVLASCILFLLVECSANNKSAFIKWMGELDAKQTEIYFWAQENDFAEIELTLEEKLRLLSLLSELTSEDITW